MPHDPSCREKQNPAFVKTPGWLMRYKYYVAVVFIASKARPKQADKGSIMTEFALKYPYQRSVSGKNHDTLKHPEVEAIGSRAACLYRKMPLTNDERDILLRAYSGLVRSERLLWQSHRGQPILITELRPHSLCWPGAETIQDVIEAVSGYIWRVDEYVSRLERKYNPRTSGRMNVPVLVDDDI
jgi:hypothetical protein